MYQVKLTQCPNHIRSCQLTTICVSGHANGTVSMWSPSMKEPLVKMLCHHGPVTAIASDNTGRHMVTCGMDNQLKIWDIRSYKNSLSYHTHRPGGQLAVSATGLIATSLGGLVQVCGGYFQKLFSCGHYYFKNIIFQSKQRETRSLLANFLFPALIL